MGNAELDRHLLAACDARWLKVARVIADAGSSAELADKDWGHRALAKRLRVLVKKRKLEAAGNIWNWRASEVRLRPTTDA